MSRLSSEEESHIFDAAEKGDLAPLKSFLNDPNADVEFLSKALAFAAQKGLVEIAKEILPRKGVKIDGHFLFYTACENGHLEVVNPLVVSTFGKDPSQGLSDPL